jgi:hypothetical protein
VAENRHDEGGMRQEDAEDRAARMFLWLAGQPDLIAGFLAEAGLAPSDLADMAGRPEFLAAVADFILQHDSRVLGAASAAGIPPEKIALVRAALPGGQQRHWT